MADTQEQLVKNWQDLKVACFQYSQRLYDVMSLVCELRSIISKLLSVEEMEPKLTLFILDRSINCKLSP